MQGADEYREVSTQDGTTGQTAARNVQPRGEKPIASLVLPCRWPETECAGRGAHGLSSGDASGEELAGQAGR